MIISFFEYKQLEEPEFSPARTTGPDKQVGYIYFLFFKFFLEGGIVSLLRINKQERPEKEKKRKKKKGRCSFVFSIHTQQETSCSRDNCVCSIYINIGRQIEFDFFLRIGLY